VSCDIQVHVCLMKTCFTFKLIAFVLNVAILFVLMIIIEIYFLCLPRCSDCYEFSIKSFLKTVYVLNKYGIFLEAKSSSAGQEIPVFY
jgi:hypothetical protein